SADDGWNDYVGQYRWRLMVRCHGLAASAPAYRERRQILRSMLAVQVVKDIDLAGHPRPQHGPLRGQIAEVVPALPATLHDEAQEIPNGSVKQTDRLWEVVIAVVNGSDTDREAPLVDMRDQSLYSCERAKMLAPDVQKLYNPRLHATDDATRVWRSCILS